MAGMETENGEETGGGDSGKGRSAMAVLFAILGAVIGLFTGGGIGALIVGLLLGALLGGALGPKIMEHFPQAREFLGGITDKIKIPGIGETIPPAPLSPEAQAFDKWIQENSAVLGTAETAGSPAAMGKEMLKKLQDGKTISSEEADSFFSALSDKPGVKNAAATVLNNLVGTTYDARNPKMTAEEREVSKAITQADVAALGDEQRKTLYGLRAEMRSGNDNEAVTLTAEQVTAITNGLPTEQKTVLEAPLKKLVPQQGPR